jgi:hypothetical protein
MVWRGLVALPALVAGAALASNGAAGPSPLELAHGRSICVAAMTGDVEALPEGTQEVAPRAAYRRLLQEAVKRDLDRDRVLPTANPALCDAARGDIIIRSDLRVDRPHDRYILTLTAGDGPAQRRETVRRENVRDWGSTYARFPDPLPAGTDDWPVYLAIAVRVDSAGLASAVIEGVSTPGATLEPAADDEGVVPSWYNPLPLLRTPPTKASREAMAAKILVGPALQSALRGAMLRRNGPDVVSPHLTENFETNGTWMLTGMRVPADGVYSFDGDRFCVEFPQDKLTCRQLLLSPEGNYFTRSPNDTRYAEPVSIIPPR